MPYQNFHRTTFMIALFFSLTLLTACKRNSPTPEKDVTPFPPITITTKAVLVDPIEATQVELPNEVLPVWRKFASAKPILVIFSQAPSLQPVPEEKRAQTIELLRSADDTTLLTRTTHLNPDPIFLPTMALSAALDAGFFSEVVWVYPSTLAIEKIDLKTLQRQLLESGFASKDEVEEMQLVGGDLRGEIHGTPFVMVPPQALPALAKPVIIHIDPSFIKSIYKNEIKTPLYSVITKLLASIKEQQWPVAAVTILRPSPAIELPLSTRFISGDIADTLKHPDILVQTMPELWELRSKALYIEKFIQKDEVRRLYQEMERKAPHDPSVKYGLYQSALQDSKPDLGLSYLKEAVTIDPIYAYEYIQLASLALERDRPEKAVLMLQSAQAALPDVPSIALRLARTLINMGHGDAAKPLIAQLKALPWSPVYHSEVIANIDVMAGMVGNP